MTGLVPGALVPLLLVLSLAGPARAAQLRVSPGPLSRAHAALEGLTNCARCHEAGRGVSAARCLGCHKPIAARIAAQTGVHRAARDDCAKCHAEHQGLDADTRRIDTRTFDHAAETGFPLEGLHARVAATCSACHKKRSYIAARPACGSCHADPHKGTLGDTCGRCHQATVPFKETRRQFDHASARFALAGAHRAVACEKCHAGGVFRGVRYDTCDACHKVPHRHALGPSCTSCHGPDRWATRTIDHAKTGFTLTGAHAAVPCAGCHTSGVTKALRFDRCAACHEDVHRNSVKPDCGACHKTTGFRDATFDHRAVTPFPLSGGHSGLACRRCHTGLSAETVPLASKLIDFAGLSPECVTCHKDKDKHKGEYGRVCDTCHGTATFKATGFVHPQSPAFFAGRHAGVACVRCHVRAAAAGPGAVSPPAVAARSKVPSTACGTCHADPHLGQVGTACERCHAIDAAKFAPTRFSHEAGAFPLTGKHRTVECVKCHPSETATFPAGAGTARRLKPVAVECLSCHRDPHLGQVQGRCTACHSTASFRIASYAHPGQEYTFSVATHAWLPCRSCHKTETGQFPGGWGTAIRLKVGTACVDCHP